MAAGATAPDGPQALNPLTALVGLLASLLWVVLGLRWAAAATPDPTATQSAARLALLLGLLAVGFLLTEAVQLHVELRGQALSLSLSEIPLVVGLFLVPPAGLLACRLLGLVAVALWLRSRQVWLQFIRRVIVLAAAGVVTYVLFPAAPPWYAANEGVIPPVLRATSRGWLWLHVNKAGNLLQEGQVASNPVAAMPSLHTAYATVIAVFGLNVLGTSAHAWVRRGRWVLLVYPVLMGAALVYLGEHYVVDLVAGVVYALAVHLGVGWWERRRGRTRGGGAPGASVMQAGGRGDQDASLLPAEPGRL